VTEYPEPLVLPYHPMLLAVEGVAVIVDVTIRLVME
jgi:hypothetical protein